MSTNLVSDITQNLNANLVTRAASAFGIDSTQVENAMSGGIPALLATLTSLASTPKGAATLNAAVAQQQPGLLSSLTNMIGDGGQKGIIDAGRNTLNVPHRRFDDVGSCRRDRQICRHQRGRLEEHLGSLGADRARRSRTAAARQWARRIGPRKPSDLAKRQYPACDPVRVVEVARRHGHSGQPRRLERSRGERAEGLRTRQIRCPGEGRHRPRPLRARVGCFRPWLAWPSLAWRGISSRVRNRHRRHRHRHRRRSRFLSRRVPFPIKSRPVSRRSRTCAGSRRVTSTSAHRPRTR